MHNPYTPPIYPSGANSLEARIKALEVAKGYDNQILAQMRDDLMEIRRDAHHLHANADQLQRRAAVWIISALLSAVAALVLIVIKLKAPWMLTP